MGNKHNCELLFQGYERIEKLNLKLLAALESIAKLGGDTGDCTDRLRTARRIARAAIRAARGTE